MIHVFKSDGLVDFGDVLSTRYDGEDGSEVEPLFSIGLACGVDDDLLLLLLISLLFENLVDSVFEPLSNTSTAFDAQLVQFVVLVDMSAKC